ncbi:MAG: preprotein translocase subunit SecG [Clostridiales bacterium]|jgi:preprotein translocase subunit SecG|nr:preprotein translocase subunit SecG [Clostridiales bacterium]
MSIPFIIFGVIYILGCFALMAAILMQKKRTAGMGSIAGMGNSSETYWDKNKSRSVEGALEKWTKIGGGVLFAYSVILCLI